MFIEPTTLSSELTLNGGISRHRSSIEGLAAGLIERTVADGQQRAMAIYNVAHENRMSNAPPSIFSAQGKPPQKMNTTVLGGHVDVIV